MSDLSLWTVYDHPFDHPHFYVARRFIIRSGHGLIMTDEILVHQELEVLRRSLREKGLGKMNRSALDEPQVLETWL